MDEKSGFKYTAFCLNLAWMSVFVLVPGLMVTVISFLERDPDVFFRWTPTLAHYRELMDPMHLRILVNSLVYALGTTVLTLVIGYPFAWFLSRARPRFRPLLLMLVIIPFWTSSLIRTYALVILMKANGIINFALRAAGLIDKPVSLLYTDFAVYAGLVYSLLPFMILPLYAVMDKMDHRLIEAAQDLGAGSRHTFTRVVLPLSLPGVSAGCIMVFLPAMGLFYIPDLLGGAKIMLVGNFIKNQFLTTGNWPLGSAASTLLILLMIVMMALYLSVFRRFDRDGEL